MSANATNILNAFQAVLLNRLTDPDDASKLNASQVYPAAVSDYIEGQPPLVIQSSRATCPRPGAATVPRTVAASVGPCE